MSDLTICNKCSWEEQKRRYTRNGNKVELKPSKEIPGWMACVVDGREISWYMEMPERCSC